MALTEEEAKTKFCPMARAMTLGIDHTPTTNGSKNFSCIASACMMWRKINIGGEGFCGLAGKP